MSIENNNRKITKLPFVPQSGMTDEDLFVFVHDNVTSRGNLRDIKGYVTSGVTDTYTTGGTFNESGNTITINNNQGDSFDITGVTSGVALTADNGITITTGNTVELGGNLSSNVVINAGNTHSMQFGGFGGQELTTMFVSASNLIALSCGSAFNISPTGANYFDFSPNKNGIVYGADYSATFVNRSLVDKGYVDTFLQNGSGTVISGGNKVFLGGDLLTDAVFGGIDTYQVAFGEPGSRVTNYSARANTLLFNEFDDGTRSTQMSFDAAGSFITSSDNHNLTLGTSSTRFIISNTSGTFFFDGNTVKRGIRYGADYSSSFTNESLVTKRYVDSVVSDITLTDDNGITITTGNTVELGGILNRPTTISGANQTLDFGTSSSPLTSFSIDSIQSFIRSQGGSQITTQQVNPAGSFLNWEAGNGRSFSNEYNPDGIIYEFTGGSGIDFNRTMGRVGYSYLYSDSSAGILLNNTIGTSGFSMNYSTDSGTTYNTINLDSAGFEVAVQNDTTLGQSTRFKVDHGITTFTDTVPNSAGIQYSADYSDNYTDLSLITKGDVKTGNILYVDNINGNDSTGEKGNLVNKYSTISAAESGATSGDTIVIMTMQNEETNLGKDQITYHFLPGTGIKNITTTGRIFNDTGKTNNGVNPLFFKITGWGDFISRTDQSATWGGTIYIYEGSSVEFDFNSSTILNLDGTKADSGFHFWVQAEYINSGGNGKLATLKGRVSRDTIGGHYFLGAHSATANVDVGGNVDVSAIFVGAQGCELIDVNVDQKITLGYSTTKSFKFFLDVDGVPFFTGNVNTIVGTNTVNISAKTVEWQNDGVNQNSIWGIFKIYEYNNNTNTHIRNNVNINIDKFLVKNGTQTVKRPFIVSSNMGGDTETVVKFNNCKITIEDGFPFTNISSNSQKDKYNIMFQDCSIDYQSTGFTSGYTIFDTSYVMPHFENTRFKVYDTTYEVVGSAVDTEIAVYGGGLFTNGVIPDDVVNINTELAMSVDTTNVFSGLNNIKII